MSGIGLIEYLETHQPKNTTGWRERAQWRRENRIWLRRSQEIALAMLGKMDELKLSQTDLAKRMGCSQQYVSKVLKGGENLSLETITKIEAALGLSILPPLNEQHRIETIANVADPSEQYSAKR
ncbi:MAG: helix-turn-helix transcriptional regulator [Bacteroidales bacterium]|nr:helix-turn-helix transcriptional regulator [Bacteroidales bacterium]